MHSKQSFYPRGYLRGLAARRALSLRQICESSAAQLRSCLVLLSAWLLSIALSGCAGHEARTRTARDALDAGNPQLALSELNEELDVESSAELPEKLEGDNALLLLDRALVLQQVGDYELSARDLRVADKQIEMLDFSRSTSDEIGRYLFSDDTGPYKAAPYEKLMVNTMNMLNYLVRGELGPARVEARRFEVMRKYLRDHEDPGAALLGPGSYLAGFIFEKSGQPQAALRHYDEALQAGDFPSLHAPIRRLAALAPYRTPRIERVLQEAIKADPTPEETARGATETVEPAQNARAEPAADTPTEGAEVLLVLNYGRIPTKVAQRIPIGLALTYAAGSLSTADRARANELAAQGLVTWVNFPSLPKPRGPYPVPRARIGEQRLSLDRVPVDKLTVDAWLAIRGSVITAAITRAITRVVAGQAIQRSTNSPLGLLASLATQATLTATDTPDTRAWSTLPARIAIARVRLPAGEHRIEMQVGSRRRASFVTLADGEWKVLNLTELKSLERRR